MIINNVKFADVTLDRQGDASLLALDGVAVARLGGDCDVGTYQTVSPVRFAITVDVNGPVEMCRTTLSYLTGMYPACDGRLILRAGADGAQRTESVLPFGGSATATPSLGAPILAFAVPASDAGAPSPAAAPPPPAAPSGSTVAGGAAPLLAGTPCNCAGAPRYSVRTFNYIQGVRADINAAASARGVPPLAVAGSIADEYESQSRFFGLLDWAQDAVVGSLDEHDIDTDRRFDFHSRLLNALENDIGPANFKVRTALALVQSGELVVPGSPATAPVVSKIIAFILSDAGTAQATAAYIAQAQTRLLPFLGAHSAALREAVLITYFKTGPTVFTRLSARVTADPAYFACPGEGGCAFLVNRDDLVRCLAGTYTPPPPPHMPLIIRHFR